MPGMPCASDLDALNAELNIPVTPAQWTADRALREKAHMLTWIKAVNRTRGEKWANGDGEDAAMGATAAALTDLDAKLGSGAKPDAKVDSLSGLINTIVGFKIRNEDHGKGLNSDTITALGKLSQRIRDEAPGASRSDRRVQIFGQEIYDQMRSEKKYPAERFWLLWKNDTPLTYDPTSSQSDRDQGYDPVFAAVEETLSRDQSDMSDEVCRDSMTKRVIDAWESLKSVPASWEAQRRASAVADLDYRGTPAYAEEQEVARRLRGVVGAVQKTATLAAFAEKVDGPVSVPKPGILPDKEAAALIRRLESDQAIIGRIDEWRGGDDAADLFAPFGDITPEQKDVITDFLEVCPPRIRHEAVRDWISMASVSNARIAQAVTSPENAQSLVELVVAQIRTGRNG